MNDLLHLPLSAIEVSRNERQRRKVDVSDLLSSIKLRGVITPIVVEQIPGKTGSYKLVAGERRYTASLELKLPDIPARLLSNLPSVERKIIELEENLKRSDLEWKDFCQATRDIHKAYLSLDPSWTQSKTASSISIEPGTLSIILRVGEELSQNNSHIAEAPNYRAAYNILARRDDRKLGDAFNDLMGESSGKVDRAEASRRGSEVIVDNSISKADNAPSVSKPTPNNSIICGDFCRWVTTFSGPPFSFLHCDFPYGIALDKSDQGNSALWGAYSDSEQTYWTLVKCLCQNLDKLLAPSSHLMFWLSSDFHIIQKTLQYFSIHAPSLDFNPKPLIWLKSDGKGILPDPKRGPRHVYETALFASRGDRYIAQSVADAYSAPKGDAKHQSEKPEPMLRHFFRMFIDEGTTFLDPTCGLGSSLRAAESLGAKSVLGIELNDEWARAANAELLRARTLDADLSL